MHRFLCIFNESERLLQLLPTDQAAMVSLKSANRNEMYRGDRTVSGMRFPASIPLHAHISTTPASRCSERSCRVVASRRSYQSPNPLPCRGTRQPNSGRRICDGCSRDSLLFTGEKQIPQWRRTRRFTAHSQEWFGWFSHFHHTFPV